MFRLSALRNAWKPDGAGPSGEVIPVNIITRPPTAELRENRPGFAAALRHARCDPERLVERKNRWPRSWRRVRPAVVARIDHLLNIAEFKAAGRAGVKVTARNFGRDRRYPITNRFRDSASRYRRTKHWSGRAAPRRSA